MTSTRCALLRNISWALILLAMASVVGAEAAYVDVERRLTREQLRATGLDTLSPAQLKLLNQLLREEAPQSVATTQAGQPVAVTEQAESAAPHTPVAPTAPNAPAVPPPAAPVAPMYIGLDDRPIESRIVGNVVGWAPGSEFLLENRQRWKVLKGEVTLRKPVENPAIKVLPGIAGRWFLQIDESMPSARAYRID